MTRLGVDRALVAGEWVAGDADVDAGVVVSVGLEPKGRSGLVAVPGFVDLQVNGTDCVDLRESGPDGFERVAAALARTGTTAFQPTCYSTDPAGYLRFLGVVREVRAKQGDAGSAGGARVLRAHLEGPFLAQRWCGAHDPALLIPPDAELVESLVATGAVGFATLAPELPGAFDVIGRFLDAGVVVSVGHSDATAAQMLAAVDAGATSITHCWNAHRRMTSRDPGPAAVALTDQRVTVGLVGDLQHVAPEMVRLAFAAAPGRIALVTDSIAASPPVRVEGGRASLPDGTLAGAVTPIDEVVRVLVDAGIPLGDVLVAASATPARLLGRDASLRPGAAADVAVLDEALEVTRTIVGGVEVWSS